MISPPNNCQPRDAMTCIMIVTTMGCTVGASLSNLKRSGSLNPCTVILAFAFTTGVVRAAFLYLHTIRDRKHRRLAFGSAFTFAVSFLSRTRTPFQYNTSFQSLAAASYHCCFSFSGSSASFRHGISLTSAFFCLSVSEGFAMDSVRSEPKPAPQGL